jgi:uncharacterized membrane protein
MTDHTDHSLRDSAATAGEVELVAAERVVFFSDAVAAIAITLLALALPPPHVGPDATNGDMLHALSELRTAYVPFLISFVVIGAHWRSHHRLFRSVARLDTFVIAVNMVWLLMIIITPYATRVLSVVGDHDFGVGFGLYAVIQVITLLAFWVMSRHLRDSSLLRPGVPTPLSSTDEALVLTVAAMFAISVPIGFVTRWAYLCWVATAIVTRWIRRARQWTARKQER